jgi:hypothetical protein
MQLPARATIAECERILRELEGSVGSVPLEIPTNAVYLAAGGEAALIQLILTWAQGQERPLLYTYAADDTDPQLESLAGRLYGVVAAFACMGARGRRRATDVSKRLKELARDRLEQDYSLDELGFGSLYQRSIGVLCVDRAGYSAPRSFYSKDSAGQYKLKDIEGFTKLSKGIFETLIAEHQRKNIHPSLRGAVGGFLHELVGNTHDHATTDMSGKQQLDFSIRGLHVRRHGLEPEAMRRVAEGYSPLVSYFDSFGEAHGKQIQTVEVSVFDAGPGLAQKWRNQPLSAMTAAEERTAVEECFAEGNTTKRHHRYGEGLPLVVRLLREQKGFLRVRTGRLSLHCDMTREVAASPDAPPEFESWQPPGGPLAPVCGTLVTILIPVRNQGDGVPQAPIPVE